MKASYVNYLHRHHQVHPCYFLRFSFSIAALSITASLLRYKQRLTINSTMTGRNESHIGAWETRAMKSDNQNFDSANNRSVWL